MLVAALASSGCATLSRTHRLTPQQRWSQARDAAVVAVDSGRYDAAARTMLDLEAAYPGTHLAADAMYWRAMLLLDPRNGGGNPEGAIALLDSASRLPAEINRHVQIAQSRRLARRMSELATRNEQLSQEMARAREIVSGAQQRAQADKPSEAQRTNLADEVQRLREELTKANADRDRANAELQRVRRRLATPTRP